MTVTTAELPAVAAAGAAQAGAHCAAGSCAPVSTPSPHVRKLAEVGLVDGIWRDTVLLERHRAVD